MVSEILPEITVWTQLTVQVRALSCSEHDSPLSAASFSAERNTQHVLQTENIFFRKGLAYLETRSSPKTNLIEAFNSETYTLKQIICKVGRKWNLTNYEDLYFAWKNSLLLYFFLREIKNNPRFLLALQPGWQRVRALLSQASL